MVGIALGTFFAFLLTTVWYIPRYLKGIMEIHPGREALLLLSRMIPLFAVLLGAHYLVVRFISDGLPLYVMSGVIGILFALLVFFVALTAGERKFILLVIRNRFNQHVRRV